MDATKSEQLKFAAQCAIGAHDGCYAYFSTNAVLVSVDRGAWCTFLQMYIPGWDDGSSVQTIYRVTPAEWQDAVLSALTDLHAAAEHVVPAIPGAVYHVHTGGAVLKTTSAQVAIRACDLTRKDGKPARLRVLLSEQSGIAGA